jgi:prefoldin subunit 5
MIVTELKKPTINAKTSFEEAKKQWSDLEKTLDDRINKLNAFDNSAAIALKKAEERFKTLQTKLATLQTDSTSDEANHHALISMPLFD